MWNRIALPEALPPCMLGLGTTDSALTPRPECLQNQAAEDLLKCTLHQSCWGLWLHPQHPPLPRPLGLCHHHCAMCCSCLMCEKTD